MTKKIRLISVIAIFCFAFPAGVLAAPLAEAEAVNLPGWLGVALTILALLLPVAFRLWVRQK